MARRGRPPKVERPDVNEENEVTEDFKDLKETEETVSPEHIVRVKEAKEHHERKGQNKVMNKFYEIRGQKLILVRKKKNGTSYRNYVGKTTNPEIMKFIKKLETEERIKMRIN